MRHFFRSRPVLTEETHRATTFEIFFDLVFVFALTRLIVFMGEPATFLSMAQGLLLLVLLGWHGPVRVVKLSLPDLARVLGPKSPSHGGSPRQPRLLASADSLTVKRLPGAEIASPGVMAVP